MSVMASPEFIPRLRFVDQWRSATVALELERARRLRAMTDEEVRKAVRDLLGNMPAMPRTRISRLVEQQAWFRRFR